MDQIIHSSNERKVEYLRFKRVFAHESECATNQNRA